jgi:C1A family cysteine protease
MIWFKRGYGWRPDLPDFRDHKYLSVSEPTKLPPMVDLRTSPHLGPVFDQLSINSCTANALVSAFDFADKVKTGANCGNVTFSRLFIYYNERLIEGKPIVDNGAYIRDGIKSIARYGVCYEGNNGNKWPYETTLVNRKPLNACYADAKYRKAIEYCRLSGLADMREFIANGYPVVFGFTVYDYFESDEMASKGVLHMPKASERAVGGHAVLAIGYNDQAHEILVQNSWGILWGMRGYFTMPYEYITNRDLSDDFWGIK